MHFIIDVSGPISMIIIGGILQENPFFTPPEEFLRELRERRAALPGSQRTDAITWHPHRQAMGSSACRAASTI